MGIRRNLLFFCTRGQQAADFQEVSRRIRALAPDVSPFVFTTRQLVRPMLAAPWFVLRPTVSVEMDGRRRIRILRGVRLLHDGIDGKLLQYKHLSAHGLPIPKWTEIVPDTVLDPKEWGPYVVVKPSRGKRGAFVWITKTGRVRFRPRSEYPENHFGRESPMLAQRFVYTGRWPVAYRVLTYFGAPIAAVRYEGRRDLPALDGAGGGKTVGGISIVASSRGSTIALNTESDVLDLARRAHAAVPDIPSLGVDIVREESTGALYLLEINPGGQAWILTSDNGRQAQAEFGLDFYSQFNALDAIADKSIEIAREHAK